MTASARVTVLLGVIGNLWVCSAIGAQSREENVVQGATTVLSEIMAIPGKQIPASLLADAQGLVIVPNLVKGGFVVGVKHGRGVALVRDEVGAWKPPMFVTLTGGSVGWQVGIQATDVILVFKTQKSVRGLMNGKFTIGADAAAAAGPVGRAAAAATDTTLKAEILSYSRSRGLFAGVALDGSALQVDAAANQAYYAGTGVTPAGTPFGQAAQVPASAQRLLDQVARCTAAPPAAVNTAALGSPAAGAAATPVAAPNWGGSIPPVAAELAGQADTAVRRELGTAIQQLQPLLDENWKRYLALPTEITSGATPPTSQALNTTLQRLETVARDPRYAALSQRAEFQAVHGLLQKYISSRAALPAAGLTLPAPPTGLVPGLRQPRY